MHSRQRARSCKWSEYIYETWSTMDKEHGHETFMLFTTELRLNLFRINVRRCTFLFFIGIRFNRRPLVTTIFKINNNMDINKLQTYVYLIGSYSLLKVQFNFMTIAAVNCSTHTKRNPQSRKSNNNISFNNLNLNLMSQTFLRPAFIRIFHSHLFH